jgi:hypothetical protein
MQNRIQNFVARRLWLREHTPSCPQCGASTQIQLQDWLVTPAEWACRACKHKFLHEPAQPSPPFDEVPADPILCLMKPREKRPANHIHTININSTTPMALYLSDSLDPENDRMFLYHDTTGTLAELLLNAGPEGNHLLYVSADTPTPDEAITAFAAWLHSTHPDADKKLIVCSFKSQVTSLPEVIFFVHSTEPILAIHHPAIGFTAGIRPDGTKLPPTWRNPDILTREQRRHFIAKMATKLMDHLAAYIRRQAT